MFLQNKGYSFESDTDTEIIAKLIYHFYLQHPNYSFRELVEQTVQQLVGIQKIIAAVVLLIRVFAGRCFCVVFQIETLFGRVCGYKEGLATFGGD